MADPVTLTRSRTYPVPVERTYERTLSIPLEQIFAKRYGLIPPVTKTEGDDPWGTPGQTRIVTTADGGRMREELLTAEPPNRFTYRLTDVQGPLRAPEGRFVGGFDELKR